MAIRHPIIIQIQNRNQVKEKQNKTTQKKKIIAKQCQIKKAKKMIKIN